MIVIVIVIIIFNVIVIGIVVVVVVICCLLLIIIILIIIILIIIIIIIIENYYLILFTFPLQLPTDEELLEWYTRRAAAVPLYRRAVRDDIRSPWIPVRSTVLWAGTDNNRVPARYVTVKVKWSSSLLPFLECVLGYSKALMAANEQHLNLSDCPLWQVGCEHATQYIRLVHTNSLYIVRPSRGWWPWHPVSFSVDGFEYDLLDLFWP